jgi:hypothetical protein
MRRIAVCVLPQKNSGVAVGCRPRDVFGCQLAIRARAIVRHEWLAEPGAEMLAKQCAP